MIFFAFYSREKRVSDVVLSLPNFLPPSNDMPGNHSNESLYFLVIAALLVHKGSSTLDQNTIDTVNRILSCVHVSTPTSDEDSGSYAAAYTPASDYSEDKRYAHNKEMSEERRVADNEQHSEPLLEEAQQTDVDQLPQLAKLYNSRNMLYVRKNSHRSNREEMSR